MTSVAVMSRRLMASVASAASAGSTDASRFARLASEWHDEQGAFRALHSMNQLRVPWIVDEMERVSMKDGALGRNAEPPRVLDMGCGGGILSLALARRGLRVRGVDAVRESIDVARSAAAAPIIPPDVQARLQFDVMDPDLPKIETGAYDAVIASEVVEHVTSLETFLDVAVGAARPGAPIFLTTINRTPLSRVAAIWLAEEVLRIVPSGMHDWNAFVTPAELSSALEARGCRVTALMGMDYNPVADRWKWTECVQINYALVARKL